MPLAEKDKADIDRLVKRIHRGAAVARWKAQMKTPPGIALTALVLFGVDQEAVDHSVMGSQMLLPGWWFPLWLGILIGAIWQSSKKKFEASA
jgi:hypothetical protein